MLHESKEEYKCVCCGKPIKRFGPIGAHANTDAENLYVDGVITMISAGYGSKHDGDMYVFGICDDCIREKRDEHMVYIGNYIFG